MTDNRLFQKKGLYNLSINELIEHIQNLQNIIKDLNLGFEWKWEECANCDKWGVYGESMMCNECIENSKYYK